MTCNDLAILYPTYSRRCPFHLPPPRVDLRPRLRVLRINSAYHSYINVTLRSLGSLERCRRRVPVTSNEPNKKNVVDCTVGGQRGRDEAPELW